MILVMGVTGSGKSYFINQLANDQVVTVGDDLHSCKLKTAGSKIILYQPTPQAQQSVLLYLSILGRQRPYASTRPALTTPP